MNALCVQERERGTGYLNDCGCNADRSVIWLGEYRKSNGNCEFKTGWFMAYCWRFILIGFLVLYKHYICLHEEHGK